MDNQTPFISPVLTGKRFDDHTIPLELLEDFAAFEELLVEVAKWLYLKEHNRKRVPNGFTNGVTLKLASINEGSSILNIMMTTAIGLFPNQHNAYFEKAKENIIRSIDAAGRNEAITDFIPENLLGYFNRIGKNLQDDETINFSHNNIENAYLTKQSRKILVLASTNIREVISQITITGTIPEADKSKSSFTILCNNGQKITAKITPQHFQTIMEAFNNFDADNLETNYKVSIKGLGRFNKNDKLESFESIEHISIIDPLDVRERLGELAKLQDGWLNGEGIAPKNEDLNWFITVFDEYYDASLSLPYLYPTLNGGIQAEWSNKNYEISLLVNFANKMGSFHSLNNLSDEVEEIEINLTNKESWGKLNTAISQKLKD